MDPFPDLPSESALTEREREMLTGIAAYERAIDPEFARSMTGVPRHGRTPVLVVVALAVLGVLLLAVPGIWALAVVAVGVLLVVPSVLVAWALRQGDPPPG